MCATCHANLTLLDVITLITFDEAYNLRTSSMLIILCRIRRNAQWCLVKSGPPSRDFSKCQVQGEPPEEDRGYVTALRIVTDEQVALLVR